jgi:hypothetical protein
VDLYDHVHKQEGVPSSAAIPLPSLILTRKIRLPAGLAKSAHVNDVTNVFGGEAALLEGEKHFFR